jgi:thiol-disulfide isomerase/thioredoxin
MKNNINFIILSILINVIVLSVVRGFVGMDIACIVAIFLYLIFTHFVFERLTNLKTIQKFTIILIGTLIVHLPQRLINFRSQLVSLPELICELIGIILGYSFFYFGKVGKVVCFSIAIMLSFTIYCKNKKIFDLLNYSNLFYKNINLINIASVPYSDTNNVQVNDTLFNSNKFIILNIWATSCGPCIAEFPEIDSLYKLSVKTKNIQLLTACILQNQDHKIPYRLVKNKKFSSPVFTISAFPPTFKKAFCTD